jgi:hypothetical protein
LDSILTNTIFLAIDSFENHLGVVGTVLLFGEQKFGNSNKNKKQKIKQRTKDILPTFVKNSNRIFSTAQ